MMSYSEIFLVSFVLGSDYRFQGVSINSLTPIIYKFTVSSKTSYAIFLSTNTDCAKGEPVLSV